MPRRCASVDGGLGPSYALASLCRLPRGRLVLLLVRARIAGVAERRLTATVQRRLASGQRRGLLRLSLLRPPRARRDEHGTALPTVHRSNDDRGALFSSMRDYDVAITHIHVLCGIYRGACRCNYVQPQRASREWLGCKLDAIYAQCLGLHKSAEFGAPHRDS